MCLFSSSLLVTSLTSLETNFTGRTCGGLPAMTNYNRKRSRQDEESQELSAIRRLICDYSSWSGYPRHHLPVNVILMLTRCDSLLQLYSYNNTCRKVPVFNQLLNRFRSHQAKNKKIKQGREDFPEWYNMIKVEMTSPSCDNISHSHLVK